MGKAYEDYIVFKKRFLFNLDLYFTVSRIYCLFLGELCFWGVCVCVCVVCVFCVCVCVCVPSG